MQSQKTIIETIAELRNHFEKRISSLRYLGREFRSLDSFDGKHKIDKQEFEGSLRHFGISLSPIEINLLFSYFDKEKDGTICFDEFLLCIRGQPNSRRQAMIDKSFLKFDKDGNGVVDASDLISIFSAKMHPRVIKGEMTESQAFTEFLANFSDRNRDGRVTRDEWNEYYAAVSSSIDSDEHFVQLMKAAWKLN